MVSATAPLARARRSLATRSRSAVVRDTAIAIGALMASLALASRNDIALRPGPHSLDWASGLLIAGSTLPLIAWRRSPRAVFIVTGSISVLLGGLGYSIGLLVGPTAALYLWAANKDAADPWSRRDTEVVAGLFGAYLAASAVGNHGFPRIELLHSGLAFAVAWFAGEQARLQREHLADLEERAMRADREVERERRLALAEERARIARDLHDSVGHAINVIAVRAGAARLRDDPERSRAALAAIEDIARQTASEIDGIVGALRDPDVAEAESTAPLGLTSLPTLVEHHAASGLDINITSRGSPPASDPAVDLAAYRILQEALTNAARHGTGRANVELTVGATAIELNVTNPIRDAGTPSSNGGHGLIGMRERATLLGGTLDVDSTNATFRLHANLPYRILHP
jgi:signal transduction histidine kinase